MTPEPRPNLSAGHRDRLRARFQKSGLGGFHDYEILELLLTYAIPRCDTKPIAKALIAEFAGLAGVLDASVQELESVKGVGRQASILLSLVKQVCSEYLRHRLVGLNVIRNPEAVVEYCRMSLAGLKHEVVHLLLVDSRNRVISDKTLFEGSIDQSQVYPRRIVEEALTHHASGFILVHNHPSGAVNPSADDKALSRRVLDAAKAVDLRFLDHLVVGREGEGYFSFREHGLLGEAP